MLPVLNGRRLTERRSLLSHAPPLRRFLRVTPEADALYF